ncbi:MAG: galactosyltransferase-related protein, partial [Planctomycetota bacterium]
SEARTRDVLHQLGCRPEQDPSAASRNGSSGPSTGRPLTDDLLSDSDRAELARLDQRARTHARLRRLGLTKMHKPKIIGAHFAVSLRGWVRVNGFDEHYTRYGMNDDEFGRRVHRSGASCGIAIERIPALHLYHPTREAARWRENPGFERWRHRRQHPIFCEAGLFTPLPQNEVFESVITPEADDVTSRATAPWWRAANSIAATT